MYRIYLVFVLVFLANLQAQATKYILSIDGGGVRGIVPAELIRQIELATNKPITDSFDMIAGTSTGGLIALFMSIPNDDGSQKYSGKEVIEIYKNLSAKVFSNSLFRRVRTLGGLVGSKYSAKPLEKLLDQYFGDILIKNLRKPVVITSFDQKSKNTFLFSSRLAKTWPDLFNLKAKDAGRATSAAPTFFKAHQLKLPSGAELNLVDGGVAANNPALLAWAEATKIWPDEKDFVVVSLGTGAYKEDSRVKARGLYAGGLRDIPDLIDAMFEAQDQSANDSVAAILGSTNFYRLQVRITDSKAREMDNAKLSNLEYLQNLAAQLINKDDFKKLISLLKTKDAKDNLIDELKKKLN